MKIVNKKIEELKPYENNPRFNDEAVEQVANSIKEFGFKVPMVIDKNNVIVAAHTRYKASLELGLKEVPCIVADDLTEEQIKAFRLADNKVSELAQWNYDLLDEELQELLDFNMEDFGFSIQIEDIDIMNNGSYEEPEEKIAVELDERNDYVVLQFKTDEEWERAMNLFNLERVATGDKNEKIRRFGIGRVINGKDILDRLEGKN
jgi:ParB-like chromosome segregation protein Spo0J